MRDMVLVKKSLNIGGRDWGEQFVGQRHKNHNKRASWGLTECPHAF